MGLVYATIELSNQFDEYKSEENLISSGDIRRWSGRILVDSGAIRMAITQSMKEQLGLRNGMMTSVTLADGTSRELELVNGIKVRFGDRTCYTDAFVLNDHNEPLLGVITMEYMDLVVIPAEQKLEYNPEHPDGAVFSLKQMCSY